jgi:hypothetical protein
MRSISRNYRRIQDRNPSLGTYLCLARTITNRKFSRKSLVKTFNELMPEDEYAKDETKNLIDHLEYLTNLPEEGEIRG